LNWKQSEFPEKVLSSSQQHPCVLKLHQIRTRNIGATMAAGVLGMDLPKVGTQKKSSWVEH
jgi:hypothetical protein